MNVMKVIDRLQDPNCICLTCQNFGSHNFLNDKEFIESGRHQVMCEKGYDIVFTKGKGVYVKKGHYPFSGTTSFYDFNIESERKQLYYGCYDKIFLTKN